jgi:hypothetical protein
MISQSVSGYRIITESESRYIIINQSECRSSWYSYSINVISYRICNQEPHQVLYSQNQCFSSFCKKGQLYDTCSVCTVPNILQNRWPFPPIPLPAGKGAKTTKQISEVEKNRSRGLCCKYLARRLCSRKGFTTTHFPADTWIIHVKTT